jgi:translocation and assembly module TamB
MRRAIYIALSIVGVVLLLLAGMFGALQTGYARDRLRMWIADATAGTSTQVQLETIEGLVPFDMQLLGIRLSDRDGTWLAADRVRIAWSPRSLLAGSLEVDELAAGTIDLMRVPVAESAPQAQPAGPLIPELPVAIDLRDLSVERLALAAPILGEPAALSLQAKAKLGDVGDGLSASLNLQQLSGQSGTATIDLAYRPKDDFLSLMGKVAEPKGGVLGRLLGLPRGSDLQVALDGQGPLEDWRGRLNASLAGKPLLDLSAQIAGRESRHITFALRGEPDPLLTEDVRPLVAGGIDAKGVIEIAPGGGTVKVSEFSASASAGTVSASGILGLREPGDLIIDITLPDSRPFATLVPDVTWSGATLQARLQGVIDRPRIAGSLAVQSLSAAGMRIGPSKLTLDASAEQGFEQPVGIRADLQAADINTPDPPITALLAHGLHLTLAGRADKAGTLVADSVQLQTGGITLSGSGRAERWGAAARQADATLAVADIAAVANPFGLPR